MSLYFAIFGPVWPLWILIPVLFVERVVAQFMLIMLGKALVAYTVSIMDQLGGKNAK